MYKITQPPKTTMQYNKSYTGETIENKIKRITNNKEPIKDGSPLIYTERKDGVQPQYDIRTDRFEIAIDAMTTVSKTHQATREQRIGEKTYDTMKPEEQQAFNTKFPGNKHNTKPQETKETGGQPVQGTT